MLETLDLRVAFDTFVTDYPVFSGFIFSVFLILIGFGERALEGKNPNFPIFWVFGGGFFIVVLIRFVTGWSFQ
ncbi:MAG: hypothetical protein AB7S81_03985 [Bdellovibrionales bacterium]